MKKLFFAFLLFCFSASLYAQEKKVLSILMKDGSQVCFLLKEKPLLTFSGDDVNIVSASEEATVARTLVDRFEFIAELPTSIENVEDNENRSSIELTDNAIQVNGIAAGCKVQLFSVNGQVLMDGVAGVDGCVTISIEPLSAGIYLINYNETTVKFLKR